MSGSLFALVLCNTFDTSINIVSTKVSISVSNDISRCHDTAMYRDMTMLVIVIVALIASIAHQ